MLSTNGFPFLRTAVCMGDSKLLQFINFAYYAFELHQSILETSSAEMHIRPGKFSNLVPCTHTHTIHTHTHTSHTSTSHTHHTHTNIYLCVYGILYIEYKYYISIKR